MEQSPNRIEVNNVNGGSNREPLSSRSAHDQQANLAKSLKGFWTLSDRVCMIKLDAKPLDINILQVYAPTSDINDEELDKFCSELETAMKLCKSTDNTIIQGDFNVKVGKSSKDENVEAYGLGQKNERKTPGRMGKRTWNDHWKYYLLSFT